tara:strand:+ start:31 stop:663 length:633 start_codon:yes stop_codon:yes gene_type:complete
MITREEQDYIVDLVKEFLPSVLEEVGFDPTVKEPGHSYGEKVEEVLANKLVDRDDRFALPVTEKGKGKQTRKMQDITFSDNFVNIKFGYKKNGQPNMCAFNRLVDKICESELDSYWILSIDAYGNKVSLFNLYDQLGFTNTNIGTGQTMLCEKKFYNYFEQHVDYAKSRKDVILQLKQIDEIAVKAHIQLKLKQQQERFKKYERELSKLQ